MSGVLGSQKALNSTEMQAAEALRPQSLLRAGGVTSARCVLVRVCRFQGNPGKGKVRLSVPSLPLKRRPEGLDAPSGTEQDDS